MRSLLISQYVAITAATAALPASACGFEDPNSVSIQRVVLNFAYPNSSHVLGASDAALRTGLLRADHFKKQAGPFAFHRTVGDLRQFASGLAAVATSDLPEFSSVLVGPVLWTRFHPSSDGTIAEGHATGPIEGKVVMVTDVPALAALLSGDVSGQAIEAAGLIRFYGNQADIARLREALWLGFPGGKKSNGSAQTQ